MHVYIDAEVGNQGNKLFKFSLDRINWDPKSSDTLATTMVFTEGM